MQVFTGHSGSVTCGAFSPSGKQVCTGAEDMTLRVWDPKTGKSVRTVSGKTPYPRCLLDLVFTPPPSLLIGFC